MIVMLAGIVDAKPAGLKLVTELRGLLDHVAESAHRFSRRPHVYFEEWIEPLIRGMSWVRSRSRPRSGERFPRLRYEEDAARRIVNAPLKVTSGLVNALGQKRRLSQPPRVY